MAERIYSCPGCWSWQLHVDEEALVADGTFSSAKEADHVVESLLREHVGYECTHPQLVQFLLQTKRIRL